MNTTYYSQASIQITQQNEDWILAYIPYQKKEWISSIKKIIGRKWLPQKRCWQLPYVKASFYNLRDEIGLKNIQFKFKINPNIPDVYIPKEEALLKPRKPKSITLFDQISTPQQEVILQVSELMTLNRYSYQTIKSYRHALTQLFASYKYLKPDQVEAQHVKSYILDRIRKRNISISAQNQIINAYKIYAEKILNRPKEFLDIPRPKRGKRLPGVLSKREVIKVIQAPKNLKHKMILMLIYSAGLRVSEAVNILVQDVNTDRRVIHIKGGKGNKDRYVVLAEALLPLLNEYLEEYKPDRWLFEGQYAERYSIRSVQNFYSRALSSADIGKYATLHTLRHSYATHCLENGHNLKDIQQALGHRSLKTTQIYLHVRADTIDRMKSPLDQLMLT